MTTDDFHAEALAFCQEHNCGAHTPVDLVEQAMQRGAALVVEDTLKRVRTVREQLQDRSGRNLRG